MDRCVHNNTPESGCDWCRIYAESNPLYDKDDLPGLTVDDNGDLRGQAQDLARSATILTGLYRELNNAEWDEFVERVGREVCELVVRRVGEKADELEAQAVSGEVSDGH